MKVVVVGGKGMLGQDVARACLAAGMEVEQFDLPELDITKKRLLPRVLPKCDWIINCAAYTDVDGAESHRKEASLVNEDGARHLAEWCNESDTGLMHISTDYVFNGQADKPYTEESPTAPVNVYGESKLAGEKAVSASCSRYLIVRTQALFGVNGRSFVSAILARIKHNAFPLKVVSDQFISPTYTGHLATAIAGLIALDKTGLVNVSASGQCSWHEFAEAIVDRVSSGGEVKAVSSAEYKTAARRPAYSILDKTLYESWGGAKMPVWQDGLDEYLRLADKMVSDKAGGGQRTGG